MARASKPGKKHGAARRGHRELAVRVKSAKNRKPSSTRWLERQLNDPFVALAKREGYRSRAAYKLIEIADKYGLLRPGGVAVDLGAAPGSWSQVATARVRAGGAAGRVVAIDLKEIEPIPGVTCIQGDFLEEEGWARVVAALGGRKADIVLSDMAPAASGHRQTDHLRIMALAQAALDFAREVLAPGGAFLAKVLQGGSERDMLSIMKREFRSVRHVKPKASRAGSAELYVLAMGYRGSPSNEVEHRTPVC